MRRGFKAWCERTAYDYRQGARRRTHGSAGSPLSR